MIAESAIEISILIFFRINEAMLLVAVTVSGLRVYFKSNISSQVFCVIKNDSAFGFLGNQKIFSLLVVCVFRVLCLLM